MQASEPLTAGKPVKPGYVGKREFEYKRHGTQVLLAGMDVVTGQIIPLVRDTRTEQDFADWLDSTLIVRLYDGDENSIDLLLSIASAYKRVIKTTVAGRELGFGCNLKR